MNRLLVLFFLYPWWAFADSDFTEQAHTRVRLVTETQELVPGQVNQVALRFEHDPHWHTYWINPGDSASAPIFNWQLPKGFSLAAPRFPTPKRIEVGPLFSFGYSDDYLLIFDLNVPADFKEPQVELSLDAEWVVCKVECVPGFFNFKKTIDVKPKTRPSQWAQQFDREQGKWPEVKAKLSEKDDAFVFNFYFPEDVEFKDAFPFPNMPVSNDIVKNTTQVGDQMQMTVDREPNIAWYSENIDYLLLGANSEGEQKVFIIRGEKSGEMLFFMALLAFLGGMILNLMPCVFPVLTLKIFAVANSAGADQGKIQKSNIAYVFGVLASFWLIAGLLLIFKQAGAAVGWGFQMQSPIFVGLLLGLFVLMGFYFLDIFRLNLGGLSNLGNNLSQKEGWWGSFFTGVLAVVVASPCTAPFMGAAMGYALSRRALEVFVIFTGLGIGLASPFVALILWPESLQGLPKPGKWMVWFKKAMALPMFATAVWLGWVLSLQLGWTTPQDSGFWQEYSQEKVSEIQSQNQGVFINFTAAWCISCQVNEQVVFQNDQIKDKIKQSGLVMLKADWTNRDEKIGQVLQKYGRAGVPLYVYFAPGRSQPIILPEILTPEIFLNRVFGK